MTGTPYDGSHPVRRPETAADAAFLAALFREASALDLSGLDPALAEQLMRHQFAGQAASYHAAYPTARFDVVEIDDEAVGRIVVDDARDAWTVVDVALRAGWRGRGIGSRLLREAMAGARAAGLPVRLRVGASNAGARRFYERLGFVAATVGDVDIAMTWPGGSAM